MCPHNQLVTTLERVHRYRESRGCQFGVEVENAFREADYALDHLHDG